MTTEPVVLAVDDEAGALRLIRLEMQEQGFRVVTASNGEDALKLAEEHRPDVVLLDVMMPDIGGLELMRTMREQRNVPVLLVTGRGGETDRVRGLEMGADDYVVKPFSADELGARIRAVLRRSIGAKSPNRVVRAGGLEIDLERRLVFRDGEPVSLTRTEWMLLQELAANPGRVMLNNELLARVWGIEYRDDLQYLRVWVSRVRQKIESDPAHPSIIKTFQGIGYMLRSDPVDEPASLAPAT
jgi:two-component system KDP operon response regulator KdpE